MATIWRIEGFEHGSANAASALRVPDAISAPSPAVAEIVTSPVRTGSRSLRLSCTANNVQWHYTPPAGSRVITYSVYIRFATLPSANSQLLHFVQTTTSFNAYLWFMNVNAKFAVSIGTTGQVEGGPVVVANTWYRVTIEYDTSTNTFQVRAIVDGGTQFSDSDAGGTASDITVVRLGNTSGQTWEAFYEDLVLSVTDGDYEDISGWPGHSIESLIPSADGTHSIATAGDFDSFTSTQFDNTTTTGYTHINHRPLQLANNSDAVIRQELGGVNDYMEFTLENLSTSNDTPQAARAYASHIESGSSGASLGEARLLLSDNTEVLTDGSISVIDSTEDPSTTLTLRKRMTIPPSGGWDRTKVDGLKARVGFADAAPDVNFIDFMIEVLLKQAGAVNVTPTTVARTATVEAPTVTTGLNVNITTVTVARIVSIQTPTITATGAGGATITTTTVVGASTIPTPAVNLQFPSRAQALARPNQVVLSGTRTTQFKVQTPPDDTTYDFRALTSTAYPFGSAYPLLLGATSYSVTTPGARTVVVGGTAIGQQARDLSWSQTHDTFGGGGLIMSGSEYFVSYDFRCDNISDGFRAYKPTQDPNAQYLLEGAYFNWIRDDVVESDNEMSGTIKDCCAESAFQILSLNQSTSDPNAVHNIIDCIFVLREMLDPAHAPGPDFFGHGAFFKDVPAGITNLTNVKVGFETNPNNPTKVNYRPAGVWTNVTYYLGPNWVGGDPVIDGVTISHDWAGLLAAVDAWKAAHGIGGVLSPAPVVGTATVPTPTVSTGAQSVFINTPEVFGSRNIPTPSVIALSAGGTSVTPTEVSGVASVLTPIISVGGALTITPTTVVGTAAIWAPTIFITGGTAVTTTTVVATAFIWQPGVSVGPLSVGEFSYNSLVFGGNREIGVLSITGLEPPDTKVDIRPKVAKDGAFVTAAFYVERYFTIVGDIVPANGDPAALEALVDTWRAAFNTQPTDTNLDYQLPNSAATLRIKCRPVRRTIAVDREYSIGLASWSVEFLAADPAIYSTADVKQYDG